jgi:hypothetical protein
MRESKSIEQMIAESGPQFKDAMTRLARMIADGLDHGFFRCEIRSNIVKGNKRELTIEAGKSHRFVIPDEELPR